MDFSQFVSALPATDLSQLYDSPWTCQAVLRSLPPISELTRGTRTPRPVRSPGPRTSTHLFFSGPLKHSSPERRARGAHGVLATASAHQHTHGLLRGYGGRLRALNRGAAQQALAR